jgi:general secretion pathway protein D
LEGLGFSIVKSPKEPGILLIPIRALRSILVIAADDKSLKYVLEWKERLDTPEAMVLASRVLPVRDYQ